MLGAEHIIDETFPDLSRHTLNLLDRLLQFVGHLCSHALEVDVVALSHVKHGGRGVDVCAVGSDSVDGR